MHPPTFADRFEHVVICGGMAAMIFLIAKVWHRALSKNSDIARVRGASAVWLCPSCYFLGSVAVLFSANNMIGLTEGSAAMGGIGLFGGLTGGLIQGTVKLAKSHGVSNDPEFVDASQVANEPSEASDNPYIPPRRIP